MIMLRGRRYVLLLFVLVGFTLPVSSAAVETHGADDDLMIYGRVLDEASGEPMAGVQVMISDLRLGTITNQQGADVLRDMPRTQNVVLARQTGFIPERREIWGCVVQLQPQGACIPTAARQHRLDFQLRSEPAVGIVPHPPSAPIIQRWDLVW
jgi:hypothetical protein